MDSSVVSHQARLLADKLVFHRGSIKPRRGALQIPVGLVTISKRLMWPIVLAVVPLVASTTAFNESHLAASYQTLPDRRPSSPTPFSFQKSTNVTSLNNGSIKGYPRWQAMSNTNHSSTVVTYTGYLGNLYRKKEVSYLTPTSHETLGSRSQVTTSGTMDSEMKGLHSSSGAIFHSSTNILSDSLPVWSSDSSSRKALTDQTTMRTGQELDITEPASRVPSTSVTPLPFSVRSSSNHSVKISPHPTLPPLKYFTDSTISRKFHAHRQVEILKTSLFPFASSPTTHSMSSPSISIVGTHPDAKHFTQTEIFLTSAVHYGASKRSFPSSHDLPSTLTWINSSGQLSTTESITQLTQRTNTTYDYLLRNANVSVMSHSPKAESSSDVANSSIFQLTTETVPHSSETGVSEFSPSLVTVQTDADTIVVSMATEANLSLGKQISHPKDDLRSQAMLTLPPGLDKTKTHEASSVTTEDTLSTSWATDRTKLELKDIISPKGEERTELSVGPTHDASSKGNSISFDPDFIYRQPSTSASLDVVHSGTGYDIPVQQDGSLEVVTTTPSYWELVEMATTTMVSPIFSSELPLAEATPTLELASRFISEQAKAERVGQHHNLHQRWRDATLSPPDPTDTSRVLTSEEPTELLGPKKDSKGVVHMLLEGAGTTLASHPSQDTVEPTSPGMTHDGLHTGGSTASPPIELFSITSPQWKGDISMPLHATASLAETTKPERTSVVTTHGSVSMYITSLDSSRTSVSELSLEMHTGAAEKAREEQEALEVTTLPRFSTSEDRQPDPKAVTSSPVSTSIIYRIAPPILPTKDLYIDSDSSAGTTTLIYNKYVDASAAITLQDDGTTTVYIPKTDSSVYLPISETTSAPVHPISSATIALLTTPKFLPTSTLTCLMRTIPSSFTPSSAQLFPTSQPHLTKKFWVSTLDLGDVRKEKSTVVVGTKATSTKEISTRIVVGTEGVTVIPGGHSSEQPESKDPWLSEATTKESLISLKTPLLLVPEMHVLPLSFRLTGMDYFESLENKTSESYKKLAKEVQLTVNKMLSTYEGFLQTNILGFMNGSLVVKCEAVFQRRVPVPTPSDVIRTIVTEVETRATDTFFDWRLDIQSLRSNGFNLNNLEPEKLAISFTALDSGGALGDVMNWDHLVTLLLGAHYTVRNISFVESGNLQGGIDINGEVCIDTDIHVDVGWALEALTELSNYSVDLTSLSINGSRLSLQVFPISFLVTNRVYNEKMMDRSSMEHLNLVRDLSGVIMHVLSKYKNLLQVAIREITGGSLVCRGDVIFQHPAPTSKDVLQTLALAVGPKDYLDSSTLQVDPFSFTVAGDSLEPPFPSLGIPAYAVVILAVFVVALIVLPILVLLPKMLGRKDKIIINRLRDLEGGIELFELDNPAFRPTLEEVHLDCLDTHMMMTDTSTFQGQRLVWPSKAFSDVETMPHSI
uniref:SEA domain-containing protein n=1 Tax=Anolis carolinensis TaxID=28377 RepID=A0A803TEQ5_ANOCA|nr:PREDICTED: mucin-17 isoform X1 [Anolis carolinensis]|eukprot:XP_008118944.1 PREDICTED: mucin-17 isoform X1 [Anolis carolinensis]